MICNYITHIRAGNSSTRILELKTSTLNSTLGQAESQQKGEMFQNNGSDAAGAVELFLAAIQPSVAAPCQTARSAATLSQGPCGWVSVRRAVVDAGSLQMFSPPPLTERTLKCCLQPPALSLAAAAHWHTRLVRFRLCPLLPSEGTG